MINVEINGIQCAVPEGTNVLEACHANGIPLEHFCYHRYLPVAGNCRTCMVEIETPRGPLLTIGCNTKVTEGMKVSTKSQNAVRAQKSALEFLLLDHPLDCPVCDKAGECSLQDNYMAFGRYTYERQVPRSFKGGKALDIGKHIVLDQERCVLCTRCIRFLDRVPGTSELGIRQRGHEARISIFEGAPLDNAYSGNVTDICPVGALTMKEFRFRQRVWFLKKSDSICSGCGRGCNVTMEQNRDRIYRYMPRENPRLNRVWLCDEGRLSFVQNHTNRLRDPLFQGERIGLPEATEHLFSLLSAADPHRTAGLGSARSTLETLYVLRTLFRERFSPHLLSAPPLEPAVKGDHLLRVETPYPNRSGVVLMQIAEDPEATYRALDEDRVDLLLVVEADPAGLSDRAREAIQKAKKIVVLSSHETATVRMAHLAIPVRSHAERYGSYINVTSMLQKVRPAYETDLSDASILLDRFRARLSDPPAASDPRELFSRMGGEINQLCDISFDTIPPTGMALDMPAIGPEPFVGCRVDFNIAAGAGKEHKQ